MEILQNSSYLGSNVLSLKIRWVLIQFIYLLFLTERKPIDFKLFPTFYTLNFYLRIFNFFN